MRDYTSTLRDKREKIGRRKYNEERGILREDLTKRQLHERLLSQRIVTWRLITSQLEHVKQ